MPTAEFWRDERNRLCEVCNWARTKQLQRMYMTHAVSRSVSSSSRHQWRDCWRACITCGTRPRIPRALTTLVPSPQPDPSPRPVNHKHIRRIHRWIRYIIPVLICTPCSPPSVRLAGSQRPHQLGFDCRWIGSAEGEEDGRRRKH